MQFRLFYQGPLYSSQGEPRNGAPDRRAKNKHEVRKQFHPQLKHLWSIKEELNSAKHNEQSLMDYLASCHDSFGMKWVPLVNEQHFLHCSLKILFLRRDRPGGIFETRDIDNKLKTLFDALRMPLDSNEFDPTQEDRDAGPIFVLLSDDKLISGVTVETDELLDPPDAASDTDGALVRAIITVNVKLYKVTIDNIAFGL